MTATLIQFVVGLYILPVATASVVAYRKNKRFK
jgi:hypothetical protein